MRCRRAWHFEKINDLTYNVLGSCRAEEQMSKTPATQEPSMEEILSSIRRIISEDDKDSPADHAHGAADPAPEPVPEPVQTNGAVAFPDQAVVAANGAANGHNTNGATHPSVQPESSVRINSNGGFGSGGFGEAGPAAPAHFESLASGHADTLTLDQPVDEDAASSYRAGAGFEGVPGHGATEEVLDLTEMVASDGRVVKITPQGLNDPALANGAVSQHGLDHEYPVSEEPLTGGAAAFGASFGQAAQAEVQGVDEVSYSDADLDGTPAYMAAADTAAVQDSPADTLTEYADQDPPEGRNHSQPAEPSADAFAELAGTEKQGSDEAMTQNSQQTQENGTQPAFGENAFRGNVDKGAAAAGAAGAASATGAGLDAMVQQMAEPMIRQWIEQNMPQMIEQIVRDEVARRLSGG
jgi:cell pole-organizing protein PopZ